jgi:alpha-L-fucosidase
MPKPQTFDVIRLREQIRLGQRVDGFTISSWQNGAWKEIHAGKTIGNQVLVRLPQPVTTDRLLLKITESAAVPCISELSLFKLPEVVETEGDTRLSKANLSKAEWKIVSATAGAAEHAIDNDPATFWHTHMQQEQNPPQDFVVDFGKEIRVSAFTYLPRQDGVVHGMTDKYRFELSMDGKTWENAAEGEFGNLRANPIEQTVPLKTPQSARSMRFTGLHAIEKNHVSAAEVGVIAVH